MDLLPRYYGDVWLPFHPLLLKPPHPELLLDGTGVGLRVQPVHVVVDGAQLAGGDGGVAAEARLQNGVVDKDILLLQKTASSLRTRRTSWTHRIRQASGKRRSFATRLP